MRLDLGDDPAVIQISTITGLSQDLVVGKLHRLWSWANRNLIDGNAPSVTKTWLDRYLSEPGFAEAMMKTGWLVPLGDGIAFKDFDRWNSQGAKRRLLTAKRAQNFRMRNRNARSVTKTLPEKRREENKNPPTPLRGEEEMLTALAAATGEDYRLPANVRRFRRVAADLLAAMPPYAPQDVQDFARRYKTLCTYSAAQKQDRPSLGEIAKRIGRLRSVPKSEKTQLPVPSRAVIEDRLRKGQPVSPEALRIYPDLVEKRA